MADDLELMRRFVGCGEEGAFGEVVGRNARWMFAAAYRQVRDVQMAEDVVQGVFVLLAQRAGKVVRGGNVAGWLFLTVQNVVRNVRRSELARKRREVAAAMVREREVVMADASELAEVLDGAVEKLPGKYREAVVMRFYREMGFVEVAAALGTSEAGARKRVERGVEMLRGKLGAGVSSAAVGAGVLQGSLLAPSGSGETAARVALSAKAGVASSSGVAAGTKGAAVMAAKMKIAAAVVLVGAVAVPTAVVVRRMSAPAGMVAAVSAPAEQAATTGGEVGTFTMSKETTGIVGPLHADGTPDYVAATNERYSKGVTPENNAFTAWLEMVGAGSTVLPTKIRDQVVAMCGAQVPAKGMAFVTYDELMKKHGRENDDELLAQQTRSQKGLWNEGECPLVAEQIEKDAVLLDSMEEAWKRPRYWSPAVSGDGRSVIGVFLPQVGKIREEGNLLGSRGMLRLGKGDFEGFLADVLTVQRMARRLGSSFTVIEALVGYALDGQVSAEIGAAAGSGRLTGEQCAQVKKAMDDVGATPTLIEQIDLGERWGVLDTEVLIATEQSELLSKMFGSNSAKDLTAFETIDVGEVDWNVLMKETNEVFDAEVAALQEPTLGGLRNAMKEVMAANGIGKRVEKDLSKGGGETRAAYTERVKRRILQALLADLTRAMEIGRTARMQEEMARAVVEAARFKAENGKWPEGLGDLVPRYLKEVPVDIYLAEAGPVKYLRKGDGILVYSVGRNRVDELGLAGAGRGDDVAVGAIGEGK